MVENTYKSNVIIVFGRSLKGHMLTGTRAHMLVSVCVCLSLCVCVTCMCVLNTL